MGNHKLATIDSYSYEPLWKQVYRLLRGAILKGEMVTGERITEVEIAEQLNVSRTPVREAFRMLELEELINIIPQHGVFVAGVETKKEIDDIFQLRMELEGLAAYLAAKNITKEQIDKLEDYTEKIEKCIIENDQKGCVNVDIAFHQIIKKASNNKWLDKFLDTLFEQATRFRLSSLAQQGRMKDFLKEHKELAKAISDGNPELAQELAKKHIYAAWKSILSVFDHEQES